MAKTFSDSPHYAGAISNEYLLGIQTGNTSSAEGGLAQMMYVKASELRAFMREGMASVYNYRGEFSTLPTDLAVGDTFYAASTFSSGGVTYLAGHLYAYNGTSWDDITNIFTQYAKQGDLEALSDDVDAIDDRLTEAEQKIDAMTGMVFKGDTTRAELPSPSASNQGWVYYLTDESIYVASDGTQWVTVMNYVVQNITEGDTAHAPSADAVYKALAQRDATDADLQSQIVNTNAELDNVEALIGGEAQVENIDPTEGESLLAQSRLIHHANLLPNGSFGRVGARSLAWNQLVPSYNSSVTTNNIVISGDGTGEITVTVNSGASSYNQVELTFLKLIAGHKYLLITNFTTEQFLGSYYISGTAAGLDDRIVTATNTGTYPLYLFVNSISSVGTYKLHPVCYDITLMFGAGNEPSTVAEALALLPALGQYNPYDTGHIYDLNPTSFLVRGVNLWDEVGVDGYLLANGNLVTGYGTTASKNYIPVTPSTAYYLKVPYDIVYYGSRIAWYDADKSLISVGDNNNAVITSPSNAFFMRFNTSSIYHSTYNHDIQICLNSLPDSVKTTYHPYVGQTVETPQIADGLYVNENCYDYVENVEEDGIVKGKKHSVVGSYTFTGSETWVWYGTGAFFYTNNSLPSDKQGYLAGQTLCLNGIVVKVDNRNLVVYLSDNPQISSSTNMNTVLPNGTVLNYELAEEEITDCEPLRSFPISDYSTVEPITPQTELVNRIDVPFSVKSISANTLIEQIIENTADIAEEKATRSVQVSALDKRVTNLELKTGDFLDVTYPSDTYGVDGVPANVEPYAEVRVLRGKSRPWSQLISTSMLRPSSTINGITCTNNGDGTFTVDGTAIDDSYTYPWTGSISLDPNHVYMMLGSNYTQIKLTINGSVAYRDPSVYLISGASEISQFFNRVLSGNTVHYTIGIVLYDLTLIFGQGNEPSTPAEAIALLPALGEYNPYDAGSPVDTTYSAVESYSINIWDEDWEVGAINGTTGQNEDVSSSIRSKNYIPISQGSYYVKAPANIRIRAYNSAMGFIGVIYNGYDSAFGITDSSIAFIRFDVPNVSYYANNIQICLNSASDKETYHPHILDTITLPSPVTLRSAGAVADTDELNVEVDGVEKRRQTKRVGQVDLGTLNWGRTALSSDPNKYRFYASVENYKRPADWQTVANILCATITPTSYYNVYSGNEGIALHQGGEGVEIYLTQYNTVTKEQFASAMSGVMLSYELAEPVVTLLDPIKDNYIEVEPNETIRTSQSQTPEIDSAMTIKYMAS